MTSRPLPVGLEGSCTCITPSSTPQLLINYAEKFTLVLSASKIIWTDTGDCSSQAAAACFSSCLTEGHRYCQQKQFFLPMPLLSHVSASSQGASVHNVCRRGEIQIHTTHVPASSQQQDRDPMLGCMYSITQPELQAAMPTRCSSA